jgi:hypothetical protein
MGLSREFWRDLRVIGDEPRKWGLDIRWGMVFNGFGSIVASRQRPHNEQAKPIALGSGMILPFIP